MYQDINKKHVHKRSETLSATKESFIGWATWHLGFRHLCYVHSLLSENINTLTAKINIMSVKHNIVSTDQPHLALELNAGCYMQETRL
jgi:hypothetical protein